VRGETLSARNLEYVRIAQARPRILSPVEAIQAATGRVSKALGLGDWLGLVKPSYSADLVVVEGNAAQDIRCLSHVSAVYQTGQRVYTKEEACENQ
jgi:imidazolonepropionase-like amidohydrolase